jgi:hypothetical protein
MTSERKPTAENARTEAVLAEAAKVIEDIGDLGGRGRVRVVVRGDRLAWTNASSRPAPELPVASLPSANARPAESGDHRRDDVLDFEPGSAVLESMNTESTARSIEPTAASSPGVQKARPAGKRRSLREPIAAEDLIGGLVAFIRNVVREEVGKPDPNEWIDQHESPLGKRRHLELVRGGLLKGRKDGKSVFVRRGEIDAYLEAHAVTPKNTPEPEGDVDRELKKLGFEVPDDEA